MQASLPATNPEEDHMQFDFDKQRALTDYVTVPAGTYLCRIEEVRSGSTRAGDERWSMKLVVAEGQHVGKQAAWDSLVFSPRGQARARLVLQALGLPHTGVVQIEPHDLEGRAALVEVRPAEYQSPTGGVVRRNEVPYDGFRSAGGSHTSRTDDRREPADVSSGRSGGNGAGAGGLDAGEGGADPSATRTDRATRRVRAASAGSLGEDEIPF
jgi:hypothetical protein